MISFVPMPSALSRTISARQTCFWAAFRSRTRISSRRRSASETVMETQVRIRQTRTSPVSRESQKGINSQISSTSRKEIAQIQRVEACSDQKKLATLSENALKDFATLDARDDRQ